jgi:hypothetical protein
MFCTSLGRNYPQQKIGGKMESYRNKNIDDAHTEALLMEELDPLWQLMNKHSWEYREEGMLPEEFLVVINLLVKGITKTKEQIKLCKITDYGQRKILKKRLKTSKELTKKLSPDNTKVSTLNEYSVINRFVCERISEARKELKLARSEKELQDIENNTPDPEWGSMGSMG